MLVSSKFRCSVIVALLLSLGGCGSADLGDQNPDSPPNADNPDELGPLVPAEETPQSDPVSPPAPDEQNPPAVDPTEPILPPVPPANEPVDQPAVDPAPVVDPPAMAPAPSVDTDISAPPAPPGSLTNPGEPARPLGPPVEPGSNLDQLIQGLTAQTSTTILSLNRSISAGTVTLAQNDCLGTYEGNLGVPLMAFDCGDNFLDVGNNPFLVRQAAFHDTPECRESLFNLSSADCVLYRISTTVPADWSAAPMLGFGGAEVAYAIGDTFMRIKNDAQALRGEFSCNINLRTAEITSDIAGANCDNTIKSIADEIKRLLEL